MVSFANLIMILGLCTGLQSEEGVKKQIDHTALWYSDVDFEGEGAVVV